MGQKPLMTLALPALGGLEACGGKALTGDRTKKQRA
jgi:hypothetical protein